MRIFPSVPVQEIALVSSDNWQADAAKSSANSDFCSLLGQKFAMLEVKSILAQTVLNYKILPSETDIILQADLILKASNGVPLRLENRP